MSHLGVMIVRIRLTYLNIMKKNIINNMLLICEINRVEDVEGNIHRNELVGTFLSDPPE